MNLRSRAAANAVRGLGGSLPLALLPSLLSRRLDGDSFAVWLIIIQMATYVTYLEFGVQTALVRATATAYGAGDREGAGSSIAAGIRLLVIATVVALVVLGLFTPFLPHLFDVPTRLVTDAQIALLIMGTSAAVSLTGSAVHGALIGAGHHWASAIVVTVSRLAGVTGVMIAASRDSGLPTLAACLGVGTVVSSTGAHAMARIFGISTRYLHVGRGEVRLIGSVVLTLGIGNMAMLVISGIDVLVVGVVDYPKVAAYGLASSLILILAYGYTIIGSALLPVFSDLHGRRDNDGAERLVWQSSLVGNSILAGALIVITVLRNTVINRWAGSYAAQTMPVFMILAVAQAIRLSLIPLSSLVLASDDHRGLRLPAIAEAAGNLIASCVLGAVFGYRGVAFGTLVGAVVPFAVYLHLVRRRTFRTFTLRRFANIAFLRPVLVAAIALSILTTATARPVHYGTSLIGLVLLALHALRQYRTMATQVA